MSIQGKLLKKGSLTRYMIVAAAITIAIVATIWGLFIAIPSAVTGKVPSFKFWEMSSEVVNLTPDETTALAQTFPATAQVDFKVGKVYGGGIWSTTGNIAIYVDGEFAAARETLDLDSNAAATSTDKYTTGDAFVLKIYNDAGSEILWTSWEVPGKSSDEDTKIYAPLRMFTKPTYSLKVSDQGGTSYSNGGTWNITTGSSPGYATGIFKFNLYNTADNTGFIPSYDPIYEVDYDLVCLVKISGTNWEKVSFSGDYDLSVSKGSAQYYVFTLSAEDICRTKTGNVVEGGYCSNELTIEVQSGIADACTVDLTVYQFSSSDYYADHGSFGTTAYTSSMTMQLTFQD